jgi:hypothetical protein
MLRAADGEITTQGSDHLIQLRFTLAQGFEVGFIAVDQVAARTRFRIQNHDKKMLETLQLSLVGEDGPHRLEPVTGEGPTGSKHDENQSTTCHDEDQRQGLTKTIDDPVAGLGYVEGGHDLWFTPRLGSG